MPKKSDVWKHFTRLKDDHGNLLYQARCNSCPDKVLETKDGTKNMWRHFNKFHKQEAAAVGSARTPQPPPPCAPSRHAGSPGRKPVLGDENASADLARMIALRGYDPSFVEEDYFRSFVRSLDPEFEVPSRVTIEKMCDEIFDEARRDSFSRIRSAPGGVSLAVGKAKTPEAGEVIYIACHFIDDQWNLHKLVLDAFVDDKQRDFTDGPILGVHSFNGDEAVCDVVSEHKGRLSMVAYDIADGDFHPLLKIYIDKCINSDAKKLICATTTYVDTVLHSIARCLLPDYIDFTADMFEEMTNLKLTRQERLQLLSELDLDLELAFDESWCATYSSLQVLRKRGSTNHLVVVDAELSEQPLCKIWEQVYRGIQTISASTSPTSNLCLAELLKLKEILYSELARVSGYDADVHEQYDSCFDDKKAVDVLREASDILDKAIQDSYMAWSVPLALDPRYKLRYIEFSFGRAFGSEAAKYITEVTNKISKLYADYTEEYGRITDADHSDGANATVATTRADPLEQAWNEHCLSQDFMVTQVNSSYLETQTELDRYLQDRNEHSTKDFDILKWWKAHSSEYPMVALMARDALAMPTCSKLSSDQLAQVKSMLRHYSKKPYEYRTFSSSLEGGDI